MQIFTVLFHTGLCKEMLLSILVLKCLFNYRVFSTKLYADEKLGSRVFRTIFRIAPKSICGAWSSEHMEVILLVGQTKRLPCNRGGQVRRLASRDLCGKLLFSLADLKICVCQMCEKMLVQS